MKCKVETLREDGKRDSCIIDLPEDYFEVYHKPPYIYDDLITEEIGDKILFEGFGYSVWRLFVIKICNDCKKAYSDDDNFNGGICNECSSKLEKEAEDNILLNNVEGK